MDKRLKKWKQIAGMRKGVAPLGGAPVPALLRASMATHLAWADRIARRFGARSERRGFAKANLTDLRIRELIRRENQVATLGVRYDQRQWIRNEFKNLTLQKLLSNWPIFSNKQRASAEGLAGEVARKFAIPNGSKAQSSLELKQPVVSSLLVRRTEQVKNMELPLVLAITRFRRKTGAGSVATYKVDQLGQVEMPVAQLVKRHRRVENTPERMMREFRQEVPGQSTFSPALEAEWLAPRRKIHHATQAAEQESIEMAAGSARGINVVQVADEVMKQLDRRLIAARERMGKI